jgi:hypothetical protein
LLGLVVGAGEIDGLGKADGLGKGDVLGKADGLATSAEPAIGGGEASRVALPDVHPTTARLASVLSTPASSAG